MLIISGVLTTYLFPSRYLVIFISMIQIPNIIMKENISTATLKDVYRRQFIFFQVNVCLVHNNKNSLKYWVLLIIVLYYVIAD